MEGGEVKEGAERERWRVYKEREKEKRRGITRNDRAVGAMEMDGEREYEWEEREGVFLREGS